MGLDVEKAILTATGAERCWKAETIQSLWSGYGEILRYGLEGAEPASVIIKHVSPPTDVQHPRGWNTDQSHLRKLRSYEVESRWYQDYAGRCGQACRVPRCLSLLREGDEMLMILEDLDATGFSERRSTVSELELHACLRWLAAFHATFLRGAAETYEGLWECGTYWHLDTRPDELQRLAVEDPALYEAAGAIDKRLSESPFQTLVHGDAKLANFCFSLNGATVAAVDFQYVGGGCGMKDVAYFIGSCLREEECEQQSPALLDFYFQALRKVARERESEIDMDLLEANWRALYPVAWTDFHRFLKGWSPGHWKIHDYSEQLAREVLKELGGDPKP